MSERKFNKVIEGIEKISRKDENDGANEREKSGGRLELLKLTPEEKAQRILNYWIECRKTKARLYKEKASPYIKESKDVDKKERKAKLRSLWEEVEKNTEVREIEQAISNLWSDQMAQRLFTQNLIEEIEESEKIGFNKETYKKRLGELDNLKQEREALMSVFFATRGKRRSQINKDQLAIYDIAISNLQDEIDKVFNPELPECDPDLAASLQHERLKRYNKDYWEHRFMWLPSRVDYFMELKNRITNSEIVPLFINGETGSGKTALADAVARVLTGSCNLKPEETAGRDVSMLIGKPGMDPEKGDYTNYGIVSEAITGKTSSLEGQSGEGGIAEIDEANSKAYPPEAIRAIVKKLRGLRPGDSFRFASWRAIKRAVVDSKTGESGVVNTELVAPKAGVIFMGILPSEDSRDVFMERHGDTRQEWPSDVMREFLGNIINIDYLEQTPNNPEVYEGMISALMDENGRIFLKKGEVESPWNEKVIDEKTKIFILDEDPAKGGTLWRFANLIGEIQKSYARKVNVLTPAKGDDSYLTKDVIVAGDTFKWLSDYAEKYSRKMTLKSYLQNRLEGVLKQVSVSEDKALLKEFCAQYGFAFEGADAEKSDIEGEKMWRAKEIGFLSPRVPRPREQVTPRPTTIVLEDGTEIEFTPIKDAEKEMADGFIWIGNTKDEKVVVEDSANHIGRVFSREHWEKRKAEALSREVKNSLGDPKKVKKYLFGMLEQAAGAMPSADEGFQYLRDAKGKIEKMTDEERVKLLKKQLSIK